jgi:hypothetical protein
MAQQVLPDHDTRAERGGIRQRDGADHDDARDGAAQHQRDDEEDQRKRAGQQQGHVAVDERL